MIVPALRRNAHEANYHGQFRRIGLLIDDRGIPAHRSDQRWTPTWLREVCVCLGMRDHHVNGIADQRQASNVNPDHVDRYAVCESPASTRAGGRLRTGPYHLELV